MRNYILLKVLENKNSIRMKNHMKLQLMIEQVFNRIHKFSCYDR